MVCSRCKMVVKSLLQSEGLHPTMVELGEVEIEEELDAELKEKLNEKLVPFGFEIIDDRKSRLIEKIKNIIVEMVHEKSDQPHTKFSAYLSEKLNHDYSHLSNLFSSVEGITIERYIILQKIEKVKELLVYDELSLSEISERVGYSDVAHLSNQFKKITGMSPTGFRKIHPAGGRKRTPLENI